MSTAPEFEHKSSTDELLAATVTKRLGTEASARVLQELRQRDLAGRAAFLVRAAEFLSMFGDNGEVVASAPADDFTDIVTEPHVVIPIKHHEQASVLAVAEEDEQQGGDSFKETPLNHVRQENERELVVDEPAEQVGVYKVNRRIANAINKICGEGAHETLGLTSESREAVVAALLDLRGEMPRQDPSRVAEYLRLIYDNASFSEIQQAMNAASINSAHKRWSQFNAMIVDRVSREGIDPTEVLRYHLGRRDSATNHDASASTNELAVGEPTPARDLMPSDASETTPVVDMAVPELADRETDFAVDVNEALAQLCGEDETLRESVAQLLTEEKYDESMVVGTRLIADLMGRYAENRPAARESIRNFDEDVYGVLKDLSGITTRANSLPRTLEGILKFKPKLTREQVEGAVGSLFEYATGQHYQPVAAVAPTPRPLPSVMPTKLQESQSDVVTSPEIDEVPRVDLLAVAKGEAKIGVEDWHAATEAYFASLEKQGVITGVQARILKDRALGNDNSREVDDITREVFELLRKKSKEPGVRIAEDPRVAEVFNVFTFTTLGVNSIDSIQQRLNRKSDQKSRIDKEHVKRLVVGGIVATLGEMN